MSPSSLQPVREYVTVTIAGQIFGIETSVIHHIFRPQNITPVPMSRSDIRGILNLRGRIVTVIDPRQCLGVMDTVANPAVAIGFVHNGDIYALLVDAVGDVCTVSDGGFSAPPDAHWAQVSKGVDHRDGGPVAILDPVKILDHPSTAYAA